MRTTTLSPQCKPAITVTFIVLFMQTFVSGFSFGVQSKFKTALEMATQQAVPPVRLITNKMCPYAQKAWIALEVSGIPYKMEEILLYGSNGKPGWFRQLNPAGTVPVLTCGEDNDVVLPDSDLILDFLSGNDSRRYSESNALVSTDEDSGAVSEWRSNISKRLAPVGKAAVLRGNEQELMSLLRNVDEDVLGPYLCGEQITVADCAAFPFLWRIDNEFGPLNEAEHGCGRIRQWLDRCQQIPAFRKTVQSSWWWWW